MIVLWQKLDMADQCTRRAIADLTFDSIQRSPGHLLI